MQRFMPLVKAFRPDMVVRNFGGQVMETVGISNHMIVLSP